MFDAQRATKRAAHAVASTCRRCRVVARRRRRCCSATKTALRASRSSTAVIEMSAWCGRWSTLVLMIVSTLSWLATAQSASSTAPYVNSSNSSSPCASSRFYEKLVDEQRIITRLLQTGDDDTLYDWRVRAKILVCNDIMLWVC